MLPLPEGHFRLIWLWWSEPSREVNPQGPLLPAPLGANLTSQLCGNQAFWACMGVIRVEGLKRGKICQYLLANGWEPLGQPSQRIGPTCPVGCQACTTGVAQSCTPKSQGEPGLINPGWVLDFMQSLVPLSFRRDLENIPEGLQD